MGVSRPCPRRHTSKAADVVLLGGDLNMHPEDVGIRLLRGWTGLRDAFAEAARFEVSGEGVSGGSRRTPGAPRPTQALVLRAARTAAPSSPTTASPSSRSCCPSRWASASTTSSTR